MKRLTLLFTIIVGIVFTAAAQSVAEFKFEQETHSFGKISQGKPVTVEFRFINSGTDALNIAAVESTCPCIKTDFTRSSIKKGEPGSITITFDAATLGAFSKSVILKSNAKTPIKVLYIMGEVVAIKGR
jgi:hypothetical protein